MTITISIVKSIILTLFIENKYSIFLILIRIEIIFKIFYSGLWLTNVSYDENGESLLISLSILLIESTFFQIFHLKKMTTTSLHITLISVMKIMSTLNRCLLDLLMNINPEHFFRFVIFIAE
jgi:hypothetical protein